MSVIGPVQSHYHEGSPVGKKMSKSCWETSNGLLFSWPPCNIQYIYKQRQSHAMSQRRWLATAVIFRPSDMSLGFAV